MTWVVRNPVKSSHMDKKRAKLVRLLPIGQTVFLVWLLCWESAGAVQSPLEVIRTVTRQALTVLEDPSYRGEEHRRERIKRMWEVILPSFDQQELAQRSLGLYWRRLTDEQRAHFTDLFIRLVKESYSSTLDRYTEDAQFVFDGERIDGDYAEVYTRILSPTHTDPFAVTYRLRRENGRWLVYDVVAENVSLVQNYRTQFYRIIAHSSYEGLVQTLEEKLKELAVS
jgi:phospholipid transport system substrate-binding protein